MNLALAVFLTLASHSVQLQWQDTTNPPATTSYNVYRSPNFCPMQIWTKIVGGLTVKTYTDTAVLAGTTYCYVVRCSDGTYESVDSNAALAQVPADAVAPTGLTVVIK